MWYGHPSVPAQRHSMRPESVTGTGAQHEATPITPRQPVVPLILWQPATSTITSPTTLISLVKDYGRGSNSASNDCQVLIDFL
jgi:hypothetical protein